MPIKGVKKRNPKPIPFKVMYTTLAGRLSETNDRIDEVLHQAIGFAKRNKPPLWHGKLHGNGGETVQVAVAWKSKHVWIGLDPDPEFETWMRDLTLGLDAIKRFSTASPPRQCGDG